MVNNNGKSTLPHLTSSPVLILLNSLAGGGSEIKAIQLANAFAAEGKPIQVAYLNPPHTIASRLSSEVPCTFLDRRVFFDRSAASRYRTLLHTTNTDKILLMNLFPVFFHNFSFNRRNVDLFAAINTTTFKSFKETALMVGYSYFLRRVSTVIFGCRFQQNEWISKYNLCAHRTTVAYNGVDIDRFTPNESLRHSFRSSLQLTDDCVLYGMVAAFRPEKNHTLFLDAAAELIRSGHPVHIALVGNGETLDSIKRKAYELSISANVHFVGFLQDIRTALHGLDVFVLPSTSVETFSNAALEAMSAQKPVIISDIGGAREMVQDRITGHIIPPGDLSSLVNAMLHLLDRKTRLQFGSAAQSFVNHNFSFNQMLDCYRQVLFE